jgi:hypothetical protein
MQFLSDGKVWAEILSSKRAPNRHRYPPLSALFLVIFASTDLSGIHHCCSRVRGTAQRPTWRGSGRGRPHARAMRIRGGWRWSGSTDSDRTGVAGLRTVRAMVELLDRLQSARGVSFAGSVASPLKEVNRFSWQ